MLTTYWLAVSLALIGGFAALWGPRLAVTLPGAAVAAGGFPLAAGLALAQDDALATGAFTVASIAGIALLVSGLRRRRRPDVHAVAGYPLVSRIRGDLTGRTLTIERLNAEAVRQRGRGEAPGTLVLVVRAHGRFHRFHAAAPPEHAASLADEAYRVAEQYGAEFVPTAADSGAVVRQRIAELHLAEPRMGASSDPEEPEFYAVCVPCSDLLNEGVPAAGPQWEQPWPCPTAEAAGLADLPFVTPDDVPVDAKAPF
ncbi:hypothetical protein [Streptomyces halstedii]|uniref:hypothetical protein n=1 Tax=Streptomyces halstedii TaxID=1944 RepID=UPI00336134C3